MRTMRISHRWIVLGGCALAAAVAVGSAAIAGGAASRRATACNPCFQTVGYVTQWSPAEDSQLHMINTLIFAFAEIRHGSVVLSPDAAKRLRAIIALKKQDPRLRVEISIGGWGAGGFSEAASTAAGRRRFADTAATMVRQTGADGIDVDWEYPGISQSGIRSSPDDRQNFTLMLKALRHALDFDGRAAHEHYTLSVAIADGRFVRHVDIRAVNR